jgi:hypothetical protein
MIAQRFGATKDYPRKRNNSVYSRLTNPPGADLNSHQAGPKGGGQEARSNKILCGFKDQARTRHPGEKCGLVRALVYQVLR